MLGPSLRVRNKFEYPPPPRGGTSTLFVGELSLIPSEVSSVNSLVASDCFRCPNPKLDIWPNEMVDRFSHVDSKAALDLLS